MYADGKRGRELFESGYYCAESVLTAVAEGRGISSSLFPKIATGFCSGMARTSGLCGAFTGGVMALGMVFGRENPEDDPLLCYDAVQELIETFQQVHGTHRCSELLGCDLGTQKGQDEFTERNLIESVCYRVTEDVTRMVLEIIGQRK